MNLIEDNIVALIQLCKRYRVKNLFLFGSALTNKFNDDSDVDFLVQFENIDILEYFDNYMDFKESLEILLGRSVDLLENQAVRNPVFRNVLEREKVLVYDRESS